MACINKRIRYFTPVVKTTAKKSIAGTSDNRSINNRTRNNARFYTLENDKGDILGITYVDDLEKIILDEFFHHPKADIIIFHLDTDGENRKQISYKNTRKHHRYENMPWGAIRICYKKLKKITKY